MSNVMIKFRRISKHGVALTLAGLLITLCSGCGSMDAKIQQHGDGTAEVKQQTAAVVVDEVVGKLLAKMEANVEARAGTQEKTDQSIAGRDKTQADHQQAGLFNLSWTEIGTGAGASAALIGVALWLYSWRKQNERTESARSDEDRRETERKWLDMNGMLTMAGKQPLPLDYMPKPWPEPCRRGWWPFSKCREAA